jgi:hypothetical protein
MALFGNEPGHQERANDGFDCDLWEEKLVE